MHYQEFIPSPLLQPHIKCYWLLSDDSGIQQDFERIIPDASPELIIHLGVPFEERTAGIVKKQEPCFLYGQLFSSIEIRPSSYPRVAGVKFHPFGLAAFTNIPQDELSGKSNSIYNIFPCIPLNAFFEQMHMAETNVSVFRIIDEMMQYILKTKKIKSDDRVGGIRMAVSELRAANGDLRIEELTRTLNMSRRELERKFNRYIGLSPKQLAKIFRLQFALQRQSKAELLTHLALEAGYYDQAHFIREFSSIVNERPSDYFALQSELTEKFLLK